MFRIFTYSVLFVLAMSSIDLYSQNKTSAYCWSPKGVNIREKPSGKAALLGKIAYKGKVTVIDTIMNAPYTDTLNGSIPVKGHWMKIQQGNVIGYAFNGYLSLIQPQTFYQFFDGLKEDVTDKTHIFNRPDGSYYSYVITDGCWYHTYFIKGGTLNDLLMLISTTEPHEPEDCGFIYTKTEGNKYYLPNCGASEDREIEVTSSGITYRSNDCD